MLSFGDRLGFADPSVGSLQGFLRRAYLIFYYGTTLLSSDRRWRGLCRACCTGGPGRDRCPCLSGVDAAREENSSAAVRPSSSASTTIGLFLLMCMSSIPTRVSWAVLSRKG